MIVTNMSSASGHLTNKRSFVLGFLFAIEKNVFCFTITLFGLPGKVYVRHWRGKFVRYSNLVTS